MTTTGPHSLPDRGQVLLQSTTALTTMSIVSITVHEIAHLVADLLHGTGATLLPNSVEAVDARPLDEQAVIAIAGPVASVVLGLVVYLLHRRMADGYGRLLVMWLGLTSAQIGFGYFLVAPFLSAGDTGKAFAIWAVPTAGYVLATVVGVVGTLTLSALTAREVAPWLVVVNDLRPVVILPWLLATLLLTAVYAAVAVRAYAGDQLFAVLAGVVSVAIFAPMASYFVGRFTVGRRTLPLGSPVPPLVGLAVAVALVVLLGASGGVTIG